VSQVVESLCRKHVVLSLNPSATKKKKKKELDGKTKEYFLEKNNMS
jgi:hypothetical protein